MFNWIRSGVISWLSYKKPLPETPLSDFERIRHELRPCDVLLVEGRSRVSEVIKLITQSLESFDDLGLRFGIIQGNHELTNYSEPIQIASTQTLARRKRIPEFDLAIVDECHTHYASLTKIMDTYNNVPFIGLSATPYCYHP